MKRVDLIRILERAGCVLVRHGGKHDWYRNPATGVSQPVPRHREINELWRDASSECSLLTASDRGVHRPLWTGCQDKRMEQFLWNVKDVYLIADLGIAITADIRECDDCPDVPANHVLQVRTADGTRRTFPEFSIPFLDPPNRERSRVFWLSGVIEKDAVPIGSELWCVPQDVP